MTPEEELIHLREENRMLKEQYFPNCSTFHVRYVTLYRLVPCDRRLEPGSYISNVTGLTELGL
jgi:hypothetical protein